MSEQGFPWDNQNNSLRTDWGLNHTVLSEALVPLCLYQLATFYLGNSLSWNLSCKQGLQKGNSCSYFYLFLLNYFYSHHRRTGSLQKISFVLSHLHWCISGESSHRECRRSEFTCPSAQAQNFYLSQPGGLPCLLGNGHLLHCSSLQVCWKLFTFCNIPETQKKLVIKPTA